MVLFWFHCLIMGMNNTGWQGVLSWIALVMITGGLVAAIFAMKKAFAVLVQKKNSAAHLKNDPKNNLENKSDADPALALLDKKLRLFSKKTTPLTSANEGPLNKERAVPEEVSDLAKKASELLKKSATLLMVPPKDAALQEKKDLTSDAAKENLADALELKSENSLKKSPAEAVPTILKKRVGKEDYDKKMKLRQAMMKRKAELNQNKMGKRGGAASEKQ